MPVRTARINDLGKPSRTDSVISHRVLRIATNKRGVRMTLLFKEPCQSTPALARRRDTHLRATIEIMSKNLDTDFSDERSRQVMETVISGNSKVANRP